MINGSLHVQVFHLFKKNWRTIKCLSIVCFKDRVTIL